MTMFLLQALLWLLVAFLLGYGIGRFLKSLFCRPTVVDEPVVLHRHRPLDVPRPNADLPKVNVPASATVLGGVAAAAGAVAVARDVFTAKVDAPDVSLKLPEVDVPDVTLKVPEVDLPDVSLKLPAVDVPDIAIDLPKVNVDVPSFELKAPTLDFSGIDPHKPILNPPDMDIDLPEFDVDVPDVSVQAPPVDIEDGISFLDMAKAVVVTAGVGLSAKVASAMSFDDKALPEVEANFPDIDAPSFELKAPTIDFSGIDPHKPILNPPDMDIDLPDVSPDTHSLTLDLPDIDGGADWLLLLVRNAKDAFRGHNPRAVTRLWSHSSQHDCSVLDAYDSLTLQPATYDKLGSSHCGAPRAGFVAVGGDVSNIEVGSGVLFHYCNIVVCRDADDNHYFIRVVVA